MKAKKPAMKSTNKLLYIQGSLMILFVLLFALNTFLIPKNLTFVDEAFSILLSKKPLPELIKITSLDCHPPLYYIILKVFSSFLGDSVFIYKFISLIPNIITVLISFCIFRKKLGTEVAVIFSIMIMTFSSSINYSHIIRMYSWSALFVLMTFWQIYGILENDSKKKYIAFYFFSMAAAYTHYYGLIAAGTMYAFLIVMAFMGKIRLKNILITSISAIITYLPWGLILLGQLQTRSKVFWIEDIPSFLFLINFIFSNYTPLIIMWLMLVFFFLRREKKEKISVSSSEKQDTGKYSAYFYWILAGCICILGTTLTGLAISVLIRPFVLDRYLYVVSYLAWLVVSSFISLLKDKKIVTIISIEFFLLLACLCFYRIYSSSVEDNIKTDRAVQTIKDNVHDGDVIYTDWREYAWSILKFYFPNSEIIHGDGVTQNDKIDLIYYPSSPNGLTELKELPDIPEETTIWYFLIDDHSHNITKMAEKKGYECKKILSDGMLTGTPLVVYKVTNSH